MDWNVISVITQVVTTIAIVVSLIYLALQVRQSKEQAQSSAQSAWLTSWNETITGWIEDEYTVEIMRKGFTNFYALSDTHKVIFQQRLAALTNQWILASQLANKGLFPENIYEGATNILISVYSTPGGAELLEKVAPAFPRGNEILEMVRNKKGKIQPFTVLFPWWLTEIVDEQKEDK
jgi:hypothetical protein